MKIRDPIHGTIVVTDAEKQVIDSRFAQRLRTVRQLGFGELAFPGATHTRHAHSLGAMHVASRLFEAVAESAGLAPTERERFRAAVRLAVLCHDLGHMPFSHASEHIAPPRAALGLPGWLGVTGARATHEDFTAKIVVDSSLTPIVERAYADAGVTPSHVASLVTGVRAPDGGFVERGADWFPLLRAVVSGELDADRMDYLLRDSFFTGVNYGRYDLEWILQNVTASTRAGQMVLSLSTAAVFAFEDFLLSRYHMFLAVYYHHTSVSFDHMLRRYFETSPGEFAIPTEPQAFLECDDVALQTALRRSKSPWAERIVARRGFKRVLQFTERDAGYDLAEISAALDAAGLEHFEVESRGVLSRYFEEGTSPSLFVLDESSGRLTEIASYTPLYQRFASAVRLSRVYVRPDQLDRAKPIVAALTARVAGAPQ